MPFRSAQIIQLGAADPAGAHHVDVIHHRSVQREDALHALAEADLAHGDGLAHAGVVLGDDGAFERLQAFLVAFLDLDVHADGVAGPELGMVAPLRLFLVQNLGQ